MTPFDRPHTISYLSSIVTMVLYRFRVKANCDFSYPILRNNPLGQKRLRIFSRFFHVRARSLAYLVVLIDSMVD